MTALSAMLDELMGKNRNAAPDEKINELHWSDEDVCKHFLCGFCPAELFTNTRSDLGVCNKTHDERTKKNYEASSRCMKMGYEEDFLRFLQNCWNDVERRIRRNHQRLQLNEEKSQSKQQQNMMSNNSADDEKMTVLNQRIDEMLENIEKLGSEGEVEQAQSLMKLCDQLKEEREQLQAQRGGQMIDAFAVQEKQMEVCEVCGAFLIVGDAQSRVDDHLMGKQHMGYAKIKSAIADLKEKLTKVSEKQREERKHSLISRTAEAGPPKRSRSRDRSHRDETSRNGNRDKDRDRRSKDHRRSHERERKRSREKESSRHRSDRDRKTSRDRDRKTSRDRDRGRDRRSDHKSSRDRKQSRERESRSSRRSSDRDRSDRKDSKHKRSKERSRSRDRKRSKRSEDKSNERKSEKTRKSSESNEKADPGPKDDIDTKEKTEITEVIEEETVEEVIEQQAEE